MGKYKEGVELSENQAVVVFGGKVNVTSGFHDGTAAMMFQELNEKFPVGTELSVSSWDREKPTVGLIFGSTESIDAVIKALEHLKERKESYELQRNA